MEKIIVLLGTFFIIFSCAPPTATYNYDASHVIYELKNYTAEFNIPDLIIHNDSTFSLREKCYILKIDRKIHILVENTTIPLNKEEVVKIVLEIEQTYRDEEKKNPQEKKNPTSRRTYYRTVFRG